MRYLRFLTLLLPGFFGCGESAAPKPVNPVVPVAKPRESRGTPPNVKFTDITAKAGIAFNHHNGAFGKKLLPETLGSGCAFFDFDNDGKQDILLVRSCDWPGFEKKKEPSLTLYRNQGDGTFDDVTKSVGLDVTCFGMGVAIGDVDNDGRADVFVTAVGGNRLFRNTNEGRFVETTLNAGDLGKSQSWPTASGEAFLSWNQPITFPSSSAFLDYDKDGKLDLFVCNYVSWTPKNDLTQGFTFTGLGRAYGPPTTFVGTYCQLYRNQGDGTFADVTRSAGIEVKDPTSSQPVAKALGVIVFDADGDGWPDIVVANDTVRNFFFRNLGNGRFQEMGESVAIAYAEGTPRGAMGIDWGQYSPTHSALLIGNFANEPNTFLKLEDPKNLVFIDDAVGEGIAGPSKGPLVFGTMFFDYDLDGRLDFLTANGHLEPEIKTVQPDQSYAQAAQLYWNAGKRPCFDLVTADQAGPDLFQPMVGRGCAFADVDGNGTLDVLLTQNGGPARLLRNEGGTGNHWVRLQLEGDGKMVNRSAIGASVTLTLGKSTLTQEVRSTRGYLSCSELPLTFGLGKVDKVDRVEIRWPGRDVPPTILENLEANKTHRFRAPAK